MLRIFQCKRCGEQWATATKEERPRRCGKCRSPYWDRERKGDVAVLNGIREDVGSGEKGGGVTMGEIVEDTRKLSEELHGRVATKAPVGEVVDPVIVERRVEADEYSQMGHGEMKLRAGEKAALILFCKTYGRNPVTREEFDAFKEGVMVK